jgi:hypothetical protein
MRFLLLPLLILLPFVGFTQTGSTGKICFTPKQAAQIADSVKQLPLVRGEARQWHLVATSYQSQAANTNRALLNERELHAITTADAAQWKKKARRRGWLNWLGAIAVGGVAALFIAK